MLRLIAILLTSALLLQVFFRVLVYVDYEINKEYITLTYCINKYKPSLKCEGKCHLAKKMKEGEKKESPPSGKEINEIHLLAHFPVLGRILTTSHQSPTFPPFLAQLKPSPYFSIFHPPCNTTV